MTHQPSPPAVRFPASRRQVVDLLQVRRSFAAGVAHGAGNGALVRFPSRANLTGPPLDLHCLQAPKFSACVTLCRQNQHLKVTQNNKALEAKLKKLRFWRWCAVPMPWWAERFLSQTMAVISSLSKEEGVTTRTAHIFLSSTAFVCR